MNMKIIITLSIITLPFCTFAETIILDAVDSGSYKETGYHLVNDSTRTGVSDMGGSFHNYNSYFVFSIPEFEDDILEITLSLQLTYYGSYDDYENILISAVSTSIDELVVAHHGGTGLAPEIFQDLMDGPELGVMQVELQSPMRPFIAGAFQGQCPVFSCTLNDTAIQIIQELQGSQFALGLSLMDTNGDQVENVNFNPIFADPDHPIQQLQIETIPEPATILLTITGGVIMSMKKRRVRRG